MLNQKNNYLTIKNKTEIAEMYLSGEIIDDTEANWLSFWTGGDMTGYEFPAKIREQLDSIGKDTPLEIHINSGGGSIFAGMAIANFIAAHRGKTTCIVDGLAASIASQIFFSADVCKIPSNAYVMLHKPFTYTYGNADEMRKAAEVLDTLQKGIATTYQHKARDGITDDDINAMINATTWLTGTETAEKFKVELIEPLKALNYAGDINKLKARGIKIPSALNFLNQPQINNEAAKKIKIAVARARGSVLS